MSKFLKNLVIVLALMFVFFVKNEGNIFAWDNVAGGDHGGADWTISGNTTVAGVHTNIGTLTVNTGVTAAVNIIGSSINDTGKGTDSISCGGRKFYSATSDVDFSTVGELKLKMEVNSL